MESATRTYPTDYVFEKAFEANSAANTYNAFEEDIAVVHFFFDKPTAELMRR